MAQREKRSVSLPPLVAQAIDQAAAEDGTTFSAWLADTAAHRLRLQAGLRAIAEWEHEHGPLTPEERADGLDRARALLGHTRSVQMSGVTYDTGALVAAGRSDRRMWALHAGFLAEGVVPVVPAPVLAEAWRGGSRQANLSRLLAPCHVETMTEDQARAVGVLAGAAGHGDVVDVTVVEGAIRRGDAVVTSNEGHIRSVADSVRVRLRTQAV